MTVLHLDRSRFFQKVLKEAGKLDSVQYINAISSEEAWQKLESKQVDLIITGQELEDGSAEKLLKRLEDSPFRHIPVIVITATDSMEVRKHFFNLGVVDFIPKAGFSAEKLKEHLDHFKRQDEMILALQKASIAILDDSRLSLNVVTSILKMHDLVDVDTYSEPRSFLNVDKEYSIYFIDLMLPGMSGEQVVVELRRRIPHAVIIAISSLDKYNTIVHVLESGADDYIIKPFDSRLLMARLKSNYRNFQLMEELQKQRNEMKRMSVTDSLTGASNHRFLINRLDVEITRCQEKHSHLSVLLLDIDKFKNVNDQYGHPTGDVVLKRLSRLFMDECRSHDMFGRYGGEEFMLIMPDTTLEESYGISEKFRKSFEDLKFKEVNRPITFSGGLIEWRGESVEDMLKRVDELLYCAKNEGRNRIKAEIDPFCDH